MSGSILSAPDPLKGSLARKKCRFFTLPLILLDFDRIKDHSNNRFELWTSAYVDFQLLGFALKYSISGPNNPFSYTYWVISKINP